MLKQRIYTREPSEEELASLEPIETRIYRFSSEAKLMAFRRRMYGWNRDNEWYRYGSRRHNRYLMIWRILKSEFD